MQELEQVKGIGLKTIEQLNKLNIYTTEDLITYYPKSYFVLKRSNLNEIKNNDKIIIDGILEGQPIISSINHKLKKITFRLLTKERIFNITMFGSIYSYKDLKIGENLIIIGKYNQYKNTITVTEIRKGILNNQVTIEPIYHTTSNLNKKTLAKIINQVLNDKLEIKDNIPQYFSIKYKFPNKLSSIKEIHNPTSNLSYKKSLQRLKYEELYTYLSKINNIKKQNINTNNCISRTIDEEKLNTFLNKLPFKLTTDQQAAIISIKEDLTAKKRMNRLIQGDVGSGKTIVAFIATYINYLSGYLTAMMVPTEILAVQHYQSALDLFTNTNMKILLLTSSTKNKTKLYKEIEKGKYDFIIGTQSLIQEKITYPNLGLIITDEQHRFGVNQRNNLKNKGNYLDILSMSATPIPRTYALTIYGDTDVTNIKTKPSGRKPVITYAKKETEILDVLKLMNNELTKGHQIYVIAPIVENNTNELDNISILKEKMNLAFGKKYIIESIHGKLETNKKNTIMEDFSANKINILISTTVIEVGVNVPNTSMIVIFNANLFGLSTLHQLRGRVGRSNIQSYCILISKEEYERLNFLEKCSDGFQVSEYDFKTRGEGDLFGTRQSGEANFKLANIKKDYELLLRAKQDVNFYDKLN